MPSILERIFSRSGPEKREALNPTGPVKLTDGFISKLFGFSSPNVTPININAGNAKTVPAYASAISFLSGAIAGLPLQTFETKLSDGTRKRSTKPISRILGNAVSPSLTSFEWRRLMMTHVLGPAGRHVSYIDRNAADQVENLVPLAPGSYEVKGTAYAKEYHTKNKNGAAVVYRADEVIDITFDLGDDMITARSSLRSASNALGLFIAATMYGSKVFENGGLPPLVVSGPFSSVGAAERAADDIPKAIGERQRENKQALVLPAGHEVKPLGMKAEEMQLTDLKRFCVEDIARVFSIPPVFLQDLANGVRSDSEQQDLHLVKHTLRPWIEQIEAELNLKLFGRENKKMSVEFNVEAILRGDFLARMEGMSKAVASGLRTPNEARALDNLPPVEGGDVAYIQGAMMPLKNQQNAELVSKQDKNATQGGGDGGED